MRHDSLIDVMVVRSTIQDLLANFHPEILGRLVIQFDPLGQKEYKSTPPKH